MPYDEYDEWNDTDDNYWSYDEWVEPNYDANDSEELDEDDDWWGSSMASWAGDVLGSTTHGFDELNRLIAQPNESYARAARDSGMERATDYLGALLDAEPGQMTTNFLEDLGVPGHEDIGFKVGPLEVGPREVAGALVGNMLIPGGGEADDIARAVSKVEKANPYRKWPARYIEDARRTMQGQLDDPQYAGMADDLREQVQFADDALRELDENPWDRYYHGTLADFSELKPSRFGSVGEAAYMTPDPDLADIYANARVTPGNLGSIPVSDTPTGANIRPIDVPPDLNLATWDDWKRAYQEVWTDIDDGTNPTVKANHLLRQRGYDGVKYGNELAVFPESLGKIRNATSGRPGGMYVPYLGPPDDDKDYP